MITLRASARQSGLTSSPTHDRKSLRGQLTKRENSYAKPSNGAALSRKVIVFGEIADARSTWEKRPSLPWIPSRPKPSIGAGFSQTAGDLEHAADQSEKTER